MGNGTTFRSMRHRNFRLFFFGQFTSQVGNWQTLVAQSLLALNVGGNAFSVGVLGACQFLPVLVFGAYGGLLADRTDKRNLLIVVQSIAMLQSFALAYVAAQNQPNFVWLCVVASVGGVAMAIDNPTRRAFFVELVEENDVNNAVGLNSSLMTSSRIVGSALAGVLISTVGFAWCFVADGFTYGAVLIALIAMRTEEIRSAPIVLRARRQVRDGFIYVFRTHDLWISMLIMGVVGTLAFNFQVVLPLFVTETFDASVSVFTALFSVLSVGALAGALHSARRESADLRSVATASVWFGCSLCALAATPWLWLAFPMSLLVGWSSIMFLTASTSIVQLRVDPEMRGRVLALQAMVFLGTTPIGGPIVGAICDAYGARVGIIVGGTAAILAGILPFHTPRRRSWHG